MRTNLSISTDSAPVIRSPIKSAKRPHGKVNLSSPAQSEPHTAREASAVPSAQVSQQIQQMPRRTRSHKPAPALFLGDKGVEFRANDFAAARPPREAQKRRVPIPNVPDVDANTLARYESALRVLAGAVGLYLHGASTLARPCVGDVENVEEMIAMIRGFGLPSVGFDATEFGFK